MGKKIDTSALKSCPCCGGAAKYKNASYKDRNWDAEKGKLNEMTARWYSVACTECGLALPNRRYFSLEDATAAWNKRNDENGKRSISAATNKSEKYMRKWWLETELDDGNIFKGWVCTTADSPKDFPEMLNGRFFVWKNIEEKGFHGWFVLDGQSKEEAEKNFQYVMMAGIYPKPLSLGRPPISTEEADSIFKNMQPVKYNEIKLFDRRLESCIKLENTYTEKY